MMKVSQDQQNFWYRAAEFMSRNMIIPDGKSIFYLKKYKS